MATAALQNPRRPANRTAQDFRDEKRLTCLMTQDPASNSNPCIAASPHFETRPDQSISPDWCRLDTTIPRARQVDILTKIGDNIDQKDEFGAGRGFAVPLLPILCPAQKVNDWEGTYRITAQRNPGMKIPLSRRTRLHRCADHEDGGNAICSQARPVLGVLFQHASYRNRVTEGQPLNADIIKGIITER